MDGVEVTPGSPYDAVPDADVAIGTPPCFLTSLM